MTDNTKPQTNHASRPHNKILHHIATACGLLFLVGYYLLIDKSGLYDWVTAQLPAKYAGSGLMLGIMIGMTPGFFIWKYYNRWIEKKLGVSGKYYEDGFYKDPPKASDKHR
ncbi:hypothetical protein Q4488_03755 [Amphritea sp. 1_MG-2023]|uniref:hypothetical protein n=1 Tax=Amphritea sp. 1_MG-2023 TaxID=3062670 RepID=UPI0026E3C31B|nr:hypothetical protein [Amphritea sp. 1_MG-2023]MDO6562492.1 hypothetical protein [Amphritea sp. 1_MG-2023]